MTTLAVTWRPVWVSFITLLLWTVEQDACLIMVTSHLMKGSIILRDHWMRTVWNWDYHHSYIIIMTFQHREILKMPATITATYQEPGKMVHHLRKEVMPTME